MIPAALIGLLVLLLALVHGFLSLFTFTLPSGIASSISFLAPFLNFAYGWFPVDDVLLALLLWVVAYFAIALYKFSIAHLGAVGISHPTRMNEDKKK